MKRLQEYGCTIDLTVYHQSKVQTGLRIQKMSLLFLLKWPMNRDFQQPFIY